MTDLSYPDVVRSVLSRPQVVRVHLNPPADPYQPARRLVGGVERDVVIHTPSGVAVLWDDTEAAVVRQAAELNRLHREEKQRR